MKIPWPVRHLQSEVYPKLGYDSISAFKLGPFNQECHACSFVLSNRVKIEFRQAHVTPKKKGQFVTLWQRDEKSGAIQPYSEKDAMFDFLVVNVMTQHHQDENKNDNKSAPTGQFVFQKTILMEKGLISTATRDGKRAFRLYPPWECNLNKTAENTQRWQLRSYWSFDDEKRGNELYQL